MVSILCASLVSRWGVRSVDWQRSRRTWFISDNWSVLCCHNWKPETGVFIRTEMCWLTVWWLGSSTLRTGRMTRAALLWTHMTEGERLGGTPAWYIGPLLGVEPLPDRLPVPWWWQLHFSRCLSIALITLTLSYFLSPKEQRQKERVHLDPREARREDALSCTSPDSVHFPLEKEPRSHQGKTKMVWTN